MALFIQNNAGTVGTGAVSALDAGVDIGLIADGDAGNIGAAAVAGRPELNQVTYAPQNAAGPCPTRLFALVNTNFGVNPQNIDIIVLAGGAGFMLADGTLLRTVGGTSLPPGATFNGTVFNPTTSVVVLYDITQNDGQGFCAKPQNSNDLTLQTANSVILYHELSHAFRQAQNATLDSTEPDCNNASAEESAAEVDENDMRDQLITAGGGTPGPGTRRDTNNHCGASCTGGSAVTINCCIVASIASGSPYSQEVNALRRIRDEFLRCSSVGQEFFDRLHTDYYAFSPQVCRLMANCSETRQLVAAYFVRPLVLCLDLIRDYAMEGRSGRDLAMSFLAGLKTSEDLSALNREQALEAMNLIRGETVKGLPGTRLAPLINERARSSVYVRWALIEPLEIYVHGLLWHMDGVSLEDLGERLGRLIDAWASRMPITDAWITLSPRAFREELAFLRRALLRNEAARSRFARRLPEAVWNNEQRARLLASAGFRREGDV